MRLTIGGVNWPVQEVIPMDSGGLCYILAGKGGKMTYKGNDHGTK